MKYSLYKYLVLLLLTNLISELAKAQLKGEQMVGASLSGNFNIQNEGVNTGSNSGYNIQVSLQYGYFTKENAAVIPSISYSRSFSNSFNKIQSTGFGAGFGLLKTIPIFSGLYGTVANQFSSNYSKSINEFTSSTQQLQTIERNFVSLGYSLRPGLLYRFDNRVALGTQLSLIGFFVSMSNISDAATSYRVNYDAFGNASAAALQFSFYYFLVSKLPPKPNTNK